jgi:hypothetical protein
VWLIYDKKGSGKHQLTDSEAVEEALCFGWIDSRPNKLDDERYMQLFSPRVICIASRACLPASAAVGWRAARAQESSGEVRESTTPGGRTE